jgi:hypothetical protein
VLLHEVEDISPVLENWKRLSLLCERMSGDGSVVGGDEAACGLCLRDAVNMTTYCWGVSWLSNDDKKRRAGLPGATVPGFQKAMSKWKSEDR